MWEMMVLVSGGEGSAATVATMKKTLANSARGELRIGTLVPKSRPIVERRLAYFVIVLVLLLDPSPGGNPRTRTTTRTRTRTKKRERKRGSYLPSGLVTSVPAGGVNSKVEAGIGVRDSFE